MIKRKAFRRKIYATLLFSLLAAVGLIVHGIFFDLDMSQIKRLSIEGAVITFLIVFPTLLLLEWIFDLENKEEFNLLEKRIKKLERKK